MFKNAEKAECFETAMWIGEVYADAAVDQDFDDVPNVMECSRVLASGS